MEEKSYIMALIRWGCPLKTALWLFKEGGSCSVTTIFVHKALQLLLVSACSQATPYIYFSGVLTQISKVDRLGNPICCGINYQ